MYICAKHNFKKVSGLCTLSLNKLGCVSYSPQFDKSAWKGVQTFSHNY